MTEKMSTEWDADLRLALRLADLADKHTMSRFRAENLYVETKPDMTPVSDADRETERLIRTQLAQYRPADGIIGEEFSEQTDPGEPIPACQWVIDPIDGTKNFVRGIPVWATLISLVKNERVVLGVVSAPALSRRWWAVLGGGAWVSEAGGPARRLQVSRVSDLASASMSYSSLTGWRDIGRLNSFLELAMKVWRTRGYGDFWSHMMVAEGLVDFSCEPELELHDMCALVPIVTEAGGRFSDLEGNTGPFGTNGLASNGLLHDEVLARLGNSS